jgi:hypothetical protein
MDAADRARERRLMTLYGMTVADYDALLAFQDGTCAICDRPPGKTRLAVDHDHATRFTRGLLCYMCNNKRVGRERLPGVFDRIADYLRNPPAGQVFDSPRVAPVRPVKKRKKRPISRKAQ